MQERIQYTLHQAGENSSELKKVLDHYQNQPEKLKAALLFDCKYTCSPDVCRKGDRQPEANEKRKHSARTY